MSNKNTLLPIFIFITFTTTATPTRAEIIKTSSLEQAEKDRVKKEFSITRDIFSPFKRVISQTQSPPPPPPPEVTQRKQEEENRVKERDVAAEVKQRIAYEGYVMRDTRNLALLTVDGESFVVGVNDAVKETIKIVSVEKKFVTVEVETNLIEIKIKGDQDNEIQ